MIPCYSYSLKREIRHELLVYERNSATRGTTREQKALNERAELSSCHVSGCVHSRPVHSKLFQTVILLRERPAFLSAVSDSV